MDSRRIIKHKGEEFSLEWHKDSARATVEDAKEYQVEITYAAGLRPFEVRLTTGNRWGDWRGTVESAVDYAIELCIQARSFVDRERFAESIEEIIEDGEKQDH